LPAKAVGKQSDRNLPTRGSKPLDDPASARRKKTAPISKAAGKRGYDPLAPARIAEILKRLDQLYPDVTCALTHTSAWELLVATILSAQSTDANVNRVTPELFRKYPTVEDFAALTPEQLQPDVRSTGFFRNKSKSVVGAAKKVVADFGGQYGSPITASGSVSGLPTMSRYTFMAGPVISYRAKAKITPFVHALFGYDRASLGASTITGTSSPVSSSASTYTDFAIALGGGVDYKLSRHFALRLGQLDYFHTTLDLNSLYGTAFGPGRFQGLATQENNLRFSTGIVLRF